MVPSRMSHGLFHRTLLPAILFTLGLSAAIAQTKSNYQVQEFMVPMRDGVHLQTVLISKANQTEPLPILMTRTPYDHRPDVLWCCR